MRVGAGVFDLPASRSYTLDHPDEASEREARRVFAQACIAALNERAPLGRDPLIKAARRHGAEGNTDKLRSWLGGLGENPTSEIVSTASGYELAPDPSDAGQGEVIGGRVAKTPPQRPEGAGAGVAPDPDGRAGGRL
jgi:hypothetical protein